MLARKYQEREGIPLPKPKLDEIAKLLHSLFKDQCAKSNKKFSVYGFTYPDELTMAVTYQNVRDDGNSMPLSYMASIDLSKESKADKVLKLLIDSIGVFFHSYFSMPENVNYQDWEESEHQGEKFYFAVTREDVNLSLQADELLKQVDDDNY